MAWYWLVIIVLVAILIGEKCVACANKKLIEAYEECVSELKRRVVLLEEQLDLERQMAAINGRKLTDISFINVTDHAYEMAKERLSINKTAFLKLAEKAFKEGMGHKDSVGNLKKWIDGLYLKYKTANNIRIYGENIFIFSGKNLVTVYQVPNNLRKAALKNQKEKQGDHL